MEPNKFKIGYIDEESQWIQVFQRNLADAFDVKIFQLTDETTLENLIVDIQDAELDCLVVDYELSEASNLTFNGDEIITKIRELHPEFPVLIITGHQEDEIVPVVEDTDIVRSKSELAERTNLFITRLKGKIIAHKKKIREIEETIDELSKKKAAQSISVAEEESLNDLFNELDRLNPRERTLPAVMYEKSNMTQLSELVKEAQGILEALKSKKD